MAEGRIYKSSLTIFIFSNFILLGNNQFCSSNACNFFEKIKGDDEAVVGISKQFHKCSIDQRCVYITKKKEDADFELLTEIKSLDDYAKVWKKVEHPGYSDCKQAQAAGMTTGVVKLRLKSLQVKGFCDMKTSGGGWTVFQRRVDGSVDFNRDWQSYKNGFGDLEGNFWLGLEALHQLSLTSKVTLRVDLVKVGNIKGFAEYSGFKILGESAKYKLEYTGWKDGTAEDALARSRGEMFSTYDSDNDQAAWNCADSWKGGWWHYQCFDANLNNLYYNSSEVENELARTLSWKSSWTGSRYGQIIYSEMKLRRQN